MSLYYLAMKDLILGPVLTPDCFEIPFAKFKCLLGSMVSHGVIGFCPLCRIRHFGQEGAWWYLVAILGSRRVFGLDFGFSDFLYFCIANYYSALFEHLRICCFGHICQFWCQQLSNVQNHSKIHFPAVRNQLSYFQIPGHDLMKWLFWH